MNDRTLVHVAAGEHCIRFYTITRVRKSPHWFYVKRSRLDELQKTPEVINNDISSFVLMRRNGYKGTVEMEFNWLKNDGYDNLSGYKEKVILPYDKLITFVQDSAYKYGPKALSMLSMNDDLGKKIPVIFKSNEIFMKLYKTELSERNLCGACGSILIGQM